MNEFDRVRLKAKDYFSANPEKMAGVKKATYAYTDKHHRLVPGGHYFTRADDRNEPCQWCGRARWQVRWDDLPAECSARPELRSIKSVLIKEELLYERLLESAKTKVPSLIAKLGMSGATMAFLHHTHGFDPEIVASLTEVDRETMLDYEKHMDNERRRSRAGRKAATATPESASS